MVLSQNGRKLFHLQKIHKKLTQSMVANFSPKNYSWYRQTIRKFLQSFLSQFFSNILFFIIDQQIRTNMQRTMPSKRVYDCEKDEFVIRNIVELESGQQIKKVCVAEYKYSLDDILGQGFSSTVYKATLRDNNKQKYAIKVIDLKKFKQDSSVALLDMEVEIVMSLNHPNIIQCLDVFKTKSFYYLIFQYCPHGDLDELIKFQKFMAEDRAIQIMKQVIDGYKHILSKNIIHRDLKPANIMRFGNKWKIGDFGFARYCKEDYVLDKIHVGTPLYLAPQSLGMNKYSFRGDFFALGVILYEMLIGNTPWPSNNSKDLLRQMKECQKPPVPEGIISEEIKQFLTRTLEIDFYNRMGKDQFKKFTFDNVNMESLIKQRAPKGVSPIVRSPSKSTGKGFFITPIKVQKNEKPSTNSNQKLLVPSGQLQINSQSKSGGKIPPSPSKIQLKIPTEEKQVEINNLRPQQEKPVEKLEKKQSYPQESSSPLFSQTYKDNARQTYNEIQFCRVIKYLIRNIHYFNFDRRQRSYLVSLLYRYCIINLKMLTSNRQNVLRLDRWDTYKKTERFEKVVREVEENVQKYEKWLNEYEAGQLVEVQILENFPLSNSKSLTTNGESSKVFIDHRFYAKMYNILRRFVHQNIEKQLVNLGDQDEKKCFYAAVVQLFQILKVIKIRTDQKLHHEGIGMKEKMKPVFDEDMEAISDYTEDILPLKVQQLLDFCSQDIEIVHTESLSPLRKGL